VQELGKSTLRLIAKLVNGNIPYHRHHAQVMNGVGRGGGLSAFWFSRVSNLLLAGNSNFFQAVNRSLGGEKNCI